MDSTVCDTSFSFSIDTAIAVVALLVAFVSLGVSIFFWSRTFRPIVTATVKTHQGAKGIIVYNLVVMNSGAIPAKHIKLSASLDDIEKCLGKDSDQELRNVALKCFDVDTEIYILQNGDKVSCSFGDTKVHGLGFWKYKSSFPISITYQGWFGKEYVQVQELHIRDSDSFTGYMWGAV